MSAPNGSTTSTSTGTSTSTSTPTTLAHQVKFLQDVLQTASTKDEATGDHTHDHNLAELLKQLDMAGDIAQGVEDKLDRLLENLEGMIGELERSSEDGKGDSEQPKQQDA